MIAPEGYLNFFELAEWAREIARDIAWAKRTVRTGDHAVLLQAHGERDAIACWLMAYLFRHSEIKICSPAGVVLRAPPFLSSHMDQIEMLPIPVPIEDSTIELPDFGESVEIAKANYFVDRFAYFSWNTGCIDTSNVETKKLFGSNKPSQFSGKTTQYLIDRQSKQVDAINQYRGWSICVQESELGETGEDLYAAFGVDEALIERLNLRDEGFFKAFFEPIPDKFRKRDRALQAYEERFPNGHEADGLTIKEATNEVSEALGVIVSIDTIRRALGKKR